MVVFLRLSAYSGDITTGEINYLIDYGGRGGSIGRASASGSYGFHDKMFESRPEHKTNL